MSWLEWLEAAVVMILVIFWLVAFSAFVVWVAS